jgi:hypothetical protein
MGKEFPETADEADDSCCVEARWVLLAKFTAEAGRRQPPSRNWPNPPLDAGQRIREL